MKSTIAIVLLAVALAEGINLLPGQPIIDSRDVEVRVHKEKLEQLPKVELASYEPKPMYCADFIPQYDWNDGVAHNVMMVESKNIARNLNDNPRTGDYSVGCFQINLLGGNLQSKYGIMQRLGYTGPLERDAMKEWLWNPKNNTAVAYEMYKSSKWSPWSATTCKKISCY